MGDIENIARAFGEQGGAPPESWKAYEVKAADILEQIRRLQKKIDTQNPSALCAETDDYVDLSVGVSRWHNSKGTPTVEDNGFRADDYRVAGDVWRVHKADPDPFPSRPHAHCIDGAKTLVGCKLHLGTAQLYKGRDPLGRFLARKQFDRLIVLIRRSSLTSFYLCTRKQESITAAAEIRFAGSGLWVPAFAGTTLTPPRCPKIPRTRCAAWRSRFRPLRWPPAWFPRSSGSE